MARGELNVWMNGERVGVWSWTRTGTAVFRYADSWLDSPNVRPLSLSLPIPAGDKELRGPVVQRYFDNLLPDSDRIRERLRRRFQTASIQAADLLAAIGRDCVGAVQLLPPAQTPEGFNRIDAEPLSELQLERLVRGVTSDDAFGQALEDLDDFRISIAGAQEKTALLRIGNQWHRPHGATPTTHIIKLPLGLVGNMRADMADSVENEWLCARLMQELGFEVAATEMARFGEQKVLVVERFDRRWMANQTWIARLPQEDMCQATGTAGQQKYESDGGPGIHRCLSLLSASDDATGDKRRFVLAQLAFWLLAATDGHAKNFSVALHRGGAYKMTPLYDILSAWPIIGDGANQVSLHRARLAMALRAKNAHWRLMDIQTRHWHLLAQQSGAPGVFDVMVDMVDKVEGSLNRVEAVLPAGFPEPVWRSVYEGVLAQRERFVLGLTSLPLATQ